LLCASLVSAALAASACGGADRSAPASQEQSEAETAAITVALDEENRSGHTGKAVLQSGRSGRAGLGGGGGTGMRVTITLRAKTGESNHAHVHDVTCAEYRNMRSYSDRLGTVAHGLRDLRGAVSDTVVRGVTVADLGTGHFSINVHEQAYPHDVIACGDIPRR
jgi:hypothetical protein